MTTWLQVYGLVSGGAILGWALCSFFRGTVICDWCGRKARR